MADKKISELDNILGADLVDADEFVVVDTSAATTKAVTYGELRSGILGSTDGITANGLDLNAIAASKAVTAVDVFVYDTSKDSDGGAWRNRCQHTSWYNETLNTATRGARREFPVVAVIVAEANKVTIYDGDDPTLPMWMVFNAANTNYILRNAGVVSVAMFNGELVVATAQAFSSLTVFEIGFPADTAYGRNTAGVYEYSGNITERNSGVDTYSSLISAAGAIVNTTVNDVAMTVLPDAPIDPATGLPVPTIAVATNGGVSVIKDDGTVVDSATTQSIAAVAFDQSGVWYSRSVASFVLHYATFSDIGGGDGFGDAVAQDIAGAEEFDLLTRGQKLIAARGAIALGGSSASNSAVSGLMLHRPNDSDQSKGMTAFTTSTYNTGWMNGDIKGAFLSDTSATALVGSGELVTNGTFDADLTGWAVSLDDGSNYWRWSSGAARVVSDGTSTNLTQSGVFEVGKKYTVKFDVVATTGTIKLGTDALAANIGQYLSTGSYSVTFVATATTLTISRSVGVTDATIDNISVKLADADRSVNNKGLIINGTVTRSPVASGAELVAYSGFSASNYLEQPYNSDLDFGTGDFCVMGWFKCTSTSNQIFVLRSDPSVTSATFGFYSTAGLLATQCGQAPTSVSGTNVNNGMWNFLCQVRSSGVEYVYVNGSLVVTQARTGTVANTSATLRVGLDQSGARAGTTVSSSLLRISATAPTADQIAKIYEDEKVLFQENAACTLYGTSDAVTALAHDDATNLLHVGTSAGRSVFQGLRRVDNTTTAVGTAISASNGLVVEE